jgi:hypothetical protein
MLAIGFEDLLAPEVTEALTDVTLAARPTDGQEELVLVQQEEPTS